MLGPSAQQPVVKLHGQGPRAEAAAARRLPACEARDAGGVTPSRLR
jgi:copper homeostasis protein CutC